MDEFDRDRLLRMAAFDHVRRGSLRTARSNAGMIRKERVSVTSMMEA
jgi:hypothetical protein